MMMGNAESYAQSVWETIKNAGSQLVQAVGDKFAQIQAAAAAQVPTLLTGDAEEGVNVAKILTDARTQLELAGVPNNVINLRLAIIEAVLRSQTASPTETDDGESFRPTPWTDGGNPKASYTVSCGFNNVVQAFKVLWAPTTDGTPTGWLWCSQQCQATYIMGFLQYFTATKNEDGIGAVSATVGDASISKVIENFVTPVSPDTPLKPGDWVWFENPYYDRYVAQKVTPLREQAEQQYAAGNKERGDDLEAQAAELLDDVQGEEGHNCIYLGKNGNGEDTFSLHGEVQTQSEIQKNMANLGEQEWVSVEWAEQNLNLTIQPTDFTIDEISIPNLANILSNR